VACGAVLGAALFSSPLLYVRQVRVLGSAGLSPLERVATAAAVRFPPRTNLLKASPSRIEAAILRLPWVASVSVRRHLPGTIDIFVHPRRPVAVLNTAAGPFELDANGVAIRRSQAPPPVPQVAVAAQVAPRPGIRVADGSTQTALVVARWTMGRAKGHVTKIVVDQAADMCLNTDDNVEVHLGQADGLNEKLALLGRIYARDPGISNRIGAINLSYPKAPACTPRGVGEGVSAAPADGTAAAGPDRDTGGQQPGD
jgi:cell division septal protein FtsQ